MSRIMGAFKTRFLDRVLLPYRLARSRKNGAFVSENEVGPSLTACAFDPCFPVGETAYNGMGEGRDGTIYFSIGTRSLTTGAKIFAFDPASEHVAVVAEVMDPVGPAPNRRVIPQGKVHVDFIEVNGRMYGATHIGYIDTYGGSERPGNARGYAAYPGGCFFNLERDRVIPLARVPAGDGIITLSADVQSDLLYALTWPHGFLLCLDVTSTVLRNHGPVFGAGETGSKRRGDWAPICRCLAVDPVAGAVFWSDAFGRIMRLSKGRIDQISLMPRHEMWRKVFWHPQHQVFYGVGWNSCALFRFDPTIPRCKEIASLSIERSPVQKPATLALSLDRDMRTIHYLAAGCGLLRRPGTVQLDGTVWYLTHDLIYGHTTSHGPLRLPDGRWVTQAQSMLVTTDAVYSTSWIEVPVADRSPRARALRALRRNSAECRLRGYAEEMLLIRFERRAENHVSQSPTASAKAWVPSRSAADSE